MLNQIDGNEKTLQLWYVYVLECSDKSLYTGYTNDLEKRLAKHRSGKGAKYTRTRLPVALYHYEIHDTKSNAMKREYAIKQMTRNEKLQLITRKLFTL